MKRIIDIILALIALILLFPLSLTIAIAIKTTSKGSIFYRSDRIGYNNVIFSMVKFRSMKIETPEVATDLLDDPNSALTPIGGFLRKSSLDEIPQLWNILKGEMSFVGPRPALFNQDDLIKLRTEREIQTLIPGLTGWAQVNGRDELSLIKKVELDREYLENRSLKFDIYILWLTLLKVIKRSGITH